MKTRTLISTRRLVPPPRREEYDAAWERAQSAAVARGAHAWRFASSTRSDLFLEFLEFAAGEDPRADPGLATALAQLGREFPSPPPAADPTEEWTEVEDR
jgi:hypothetical protein